MPISARSRALARPLLARLPFLRSPRSFSSAAFVQNNERSHPDLTVEFRGTAPAALPDPFVLVQPMLRPLDASIKEQLSTDHPILVAAAHHFFERAGKRFRPTLVLLTASAARGGGEADARQRRLAEIAEMIHAASLLHDDVIDVADTRRGAKAAHKIYGNKVAVLAGDFLLARSSLMMARLGDLKVVELLSTIIEEMVQGEMMQVGRDDGVCIDIL